jgi:hypothetical protein
MARPYRRRAVLSVSRAYSHDPLERINSIGGIDSDRKHWRLSQVAAIAAIEARTDEFFIKSGAAEVKVVVFSQHGQKYLTTEGAATQADDLLSLMLA